MSLLCAAPFELDAKPADACPGAAVPVTLTGAIPTGTAFTLDTADVEIADAGVSPTAWSATLVVKPAALPQGVSVLATAKSGAQLRVAVLNVGCKPVFKIDLDTGETLTLRIDWQKGNVRGGRGTGVWTKAGKTLDKAEWLASGSRTSFTFERIVTDAETTDRMLAARNQLMSPEHQALLKKRGDATQRLNACMANHSGNAKALSACIGPIQGELNRIQLEMDQRMKKMKSGPKAGCELLNVEVENGKVRGDADRCADGLSHAFSGTVQAG